MCQRPYTYIYTAAPFGHTPPPSRFYRELFPIDRLFFASFLSVHWHDDSGNTEECIVIMIKITCAHTHIIYYVQTHNMLFVRIPVTRTRRFRYIMYTLLCAGNSPFNGNGRSKDTTACVSLSSQGCARTIPIIAGST